MRVILVSLLTTLFLCPLFASAPKVQIALLLDTSGSMDGLIDQARSRLWGIVSDMSRAHKNGQTPVFEVALYEYGKSSIPQSQGYIAQLLPLTTDLDKVSEALFALRTNGGDEYCGQAIQVACQQLNWSKDPDDYKAIFIAGNESFDQGQVSFRTTCPQARNADIIVNTIFCGDQTEGISTHWKSGADLGGGKFLVIDQNQVVAVAQAPQDAEILKLGQKLNETYVAFGASGSSSKNRQKEQDVKAAGVSIESAVQRTVAKASKSYRAEKWDLVDAAEKQEVDISKLDKDALPEPMRAMDDVQKQNYLAEQGEKRKQLQSKIAELQKERADHLAKTQTTGPKNTLDEAMQTTITQQLKDKKFQVTTDKQQAPSGK